jgi:hypothetical protein
LVSLADWVTRRLVVVIAVIFVVGAVTGSMIGYVAGRNAGNKKINAAPGPTATRGPAAASGPTTAPGATRTVIASPSPATGAAAGPDRTLPGSPTRVNEFGIPVGYPHTEAGAVSACGNYVSAYLDSANREPSKIENIFRSITMNNVAKRLAQAIIAIDRQTSREYNVDSIQSPKMGFSLRVVGYKIENHRPNQTTIDVWSTGSVGVYGGPDNLKPRESWGIDVCTVSWDGADWKLFDAGDGPDGPMLTDRNSEGFRRFILIGAAA